jgi:hypothetical protein
VYLGTIANLVQPEKEARCNGKSNQMLSLSTKLQGNTRFDQESPNQNINYGNTRFDQESPNQNINYGKKEHLYRK